MPVSWLKNPDTWTRSTRKGNWAPFQKSMWKVDPPISWQDVEAFHSPSRNKKSLYLRACLDLVFLCPWFLQGPIQGLQTICYCSFKTCSWVFPFRVISFLIFGCGSSYHPWCTFPHLYYITCPILNWSTPSLTLSHHISPKMQVISYKTIWCCNPQAHNLKHIKLTLVFVHNFTSKLSKWLRTHFQIMPTLNYASKIQYFIRNAVGNSISKTGTCSRNFIHKQYIFMIYSNFLH